MKRIHGMRSRAAQARDVELRIQHMMDCGRQQAKTMRLLPDDEVIMGERLGLLNVENMIIPRYNQRPSKGWRRHMRRTKAGAPVPAPPS